MSVLAKRVGTLALLMLAAPCALANTALTLLTAEGQAQRVTGIAKARLMREGMTESGRGVLLDEYAVVSIEADGLRYAATSSGYARSASELKRVAHFVEPFKAGVSRSSDAATSVRAPNARALLIQHQLAHPHNSRFTPPPTASYERQRVESGSLSGERGFAIVSIGESGRVLRVELLSSASASNVTLRQAIARGIRTKFQDERRHDHTVYMAYEVQQDTVTQLGQAVVIVPECCGEPPCNPGCP